MSNWRNYEAMSRDELITRLRKAEDVCVYFGWTAVVNDSDRALAAGELWQRWAQQPGVDTSVKGNAELAASQDVFAEARRATRTATLSRLSADD